MLVKLVNDYNLIAAQAILVICLSNLYSLRNYTILESLNKLGFFVTIGTIAYKVSALGILGYLVLSFINGVWLYPFIILIIGTIISLPLVKILMASKIIKSNSLDNPPVIMGLSGIIFFICLTELVKSVM